MKVSLHAQITHPVNVNLCCHLVTSILLLNFSFVVDVVEMIEMRGIYGYRKLKSIF